MTRQCLWCWIKLIRRVIVSCIFMMSTPAFADPETRTLEIFTNRNFPVTGLEAARDAGWVIRLYEFDAPKRVAQALGEGLPGNLKQAKAIVLDRVDRIGRDEIKRRFQSAYQGSFKAFEYRIKKYPALVFDRGKAVIYSIPDVEHAIQQYQNWKDGRDD